MTGLIIRCALRYAAGVLVTRGLLGAEDAASIVADPELQAYLEVGVGLAIGGITETWHVLARRFGWGH